MGVSCILVGKRMEVRREGPARPPKAVAPAGDASGIVLESEARGARGRPVVVGMVAAWRMLGLRPATGRVVMVEQVLLRRVWGGEG